MRDTGGADGGPPGLHAVAREPMAGDVQYEASRALRRRVQDLEALQAAVLEIAVLQDPALLLETILDRAMRLLDAPMGALHICEPDRRRVRCMVRCDTPGDEASFEYGEGMVGLVAETGEPLILESSSSIDGWTEVSAAERRLGTMLGMALAVPMNHQKHILGVIWLETAGGARCFGQADLELLTEFACHAAIAIENARLYDWVLNEISECRCVEQQSRERHLYLERLLACTPDATVTLDAQQRVLEWNPGAEKLFGYLPGEARGRDLDELIALPDPEMFKEATALTSQVLSGKSVLPTETVRFHKDGTPIDVIVAGSPIIIGNRLVGTVAVYTDNSERKQAQEALALHAREMAALYETSLEINAQPDLPTLLREIIERASGLVGARMGGLYLMVPDKDRLELAVSHNLPGDHVGAMLCLEEGLPGKVAESGEPMMVADYGHWKDGASIHAGDAFRRVLGVPLKLGERVLGVIFVADDERTGLFEEDEVRLVSLFADQAVVAIENARLFEAEREHRELAEALGQATAAVSSTLDLEQILDHILEQVDRVIHGDAANIMLIEGELACIVRSRGYKDAGQDVLGLTLRLPDVPMLSQMRETGEPVIIRDTESDPNWVQLPELAWGRSCAAAPIRARDQVIGILSLDSATPGFFAKEHADRLCAFADQASLALSNAQLFRIVEGAKRDWEGTFDAMPDPVILVDRGDRIVRANRAFADLVQKPFPLLVGQAYHSILEGTRCPEPLCPLDQAVRNRRAATCVHDYEGRIFEIQATPVIGGAAGESVQATPTIYALRDITERRSAEQQVHRRNRELVLLNRIIAASVTSPATGSFLETVCRELAEAFDASKALTTLISEEGTHTFVAAGYLAEGQFGSLGKVVPIKDDPCSHYLLQHPNLLVAEEARSDPRLDSCLNMVEQEGTVSLVLLPLLVEGTVAGSLRIDFTQPRVFSPGEVDLAQRVADQVSSALARIRLEEARRRLNAAVEQAAEAVVITGTDRSIQYANPAFEQITGYDRAGLLGEDSHRLLSVGQDPTVQIEMWQTVTAGRTWQGRFTDDRPDGSPYTVDSTISPVRNRAGEIVNFVATLRDITREVELEKQFQQAQKMEALGRLAGGIAHDFNNLLTVIHLSTRLLERKLPPEESLLNHVQQIREAGERAARLTKQLLSFSRREVIEPRVLNLNKVVGELSEMLLRIIGEDVDLSIELADDLWPVKVDPAQTEQVLMNLVVNSRDAMPNGGTLTLKTANITLDPAYVSAHVDAQPGDHVLLTVSDTGQGMSREVQSHLFEPFFTTKEQGQGTGLGLSTVFGIIRRSGGHIRVESHEGAGTSFKIYLPRDSKVEVKTPAQFLQPSSDPSGPGIETILVVEDDVGVRHLAVRVLVSYGYHVLEAESGPEALQVSEQYEKPIHLLLTDVVMPKMNGRELVDRLRGPRSRMPVLYMSGYADDAISQIGALPRDTAFLPKPFSVEDLIRKVRTLMADQG